ncbi:hypothetical protein EGW08_010697 [Elysia chlorotica]|uniref:MADF domain-containing protein n=1 Tax=Elysia chlorotica TaxID=188477 RepID=A0A3S1BIG4_ELYCH|nr:hypothetical protein EGW08_010697 [Elysia chlorotica]
MNRADRDFAENLVLAVKKRPAIYAPSHPNHKDRYKIDLEWTGIAAELNSTVESVKRRWQNLRGSFSKSLSAMKNQSALALIKAEDTGSSLTTSVKAEER